MFRFLVGFMFLIAAWVVAHQLLPHDFFSITTLWIFLIMLLSHLGLTLVPGPRLPW